jgi:biotin transport system substrate-specific component
MSSFLTEKKLSIAHPYLLELVKNIGLAILFAIITAISSKIEIPAVPVPFTFQTMAVILSGVVLGRKMGFFSQLTYLGMGMFGLPVFAHTADFSFGMAAIFSPTGGYLLAFPVAAFVAGSIAGSSKNIGGFVFAFLSGEAVILTSGMLFLSSFFFHDLARSFQFGVAPFLLWTIAKVVLGTGSAKAIFTVKAGIKK